MTRAFKADPEVALEQYPDDKRISAAKKALDVVNQRHAGTARGDMWVRKIQ